MKLLDLARLKAELKYDPTTGDFRRDGVIAGTSWAHRNTRYRKISIDGQQYLAHRLAWFYMHGLWPAHEIDHINGNGSDNRIANLRQATRGENSTNSPAQKSNKIGLRGVHFHRGAKRYRAQICKNLKITHLGYFDTAEDAHAAYLTAAHKLHGEFVR